MDMHIRTRTSIEGSIKKIQISVNNYKTVPLESTKVKSLLGRLETLEIQADNVHTAILRACKTECEANDQSEIADTLIDEIITVRSGLMDIQATLPTEDQTKINRVSVKLPTLDMPKFDGNYENWVSFEDLFTATVDKDSRLSNVQKLQYLQSAVQGEAALLNRSFPVTNLNYPVDWKMLVDRYKNEREIVMSTIRHLCNQVDIKQESSSQLQQLVDTTNECMRQLTGLGRTIDQWDDIIIVILIDKLDAESKRQWAMSLKGTNMPTLIELMEFLDSHIRGILAAGVNADPVLKKSHNRTDRKSAMTHHAEATKNCLNCKGTHSLYSCQQFLALSISERYDVVKKNNLCFNCMRAGHRTRECNSKSTCEHSNQNHNSLLHKDISQPSKQGETDASQPAGAIFFSSVNTDVLLSTALVHVKDKTGNKHTCRVLIDGCSQPSLISEACMARLRLPRTRVEVQLSGVAGTVVGNSHSQVKLELSSMINSTIMQIDALVVTKVAGAMPNFKCSGYRKWVHLNGIELADPTFAQQGHTDILLGAEYAAAAMGEGKIMEEVNQPIGLNTVFEWILSGRVAATHLTSLQVLHATFNNTDSIIQRFWELEQIPNKKHFTPEEQISEKHYKDTHSRDSTGRYIVKLPFTDSIRKLGSSRDMAERKLLQIERRLASQPKIKERDHKFMEEFQQLQHMQSIPQEYLHQPVGQDYNPPHHFVLKGLSSTTKLRVVFDASAITTSGISLNDCMLVGPTIQSSLYTLLLRFRSHIVALKADITKMYRSFLIADEDKHYQRVLWRESPKHPIQDYWLTTVTYGTAAALFLATRTIQQLAEDESSSYPVGAAALLSDLYVDDLIGGGANTEEALNIQQQLSSLVQCGGMELRMWASNDSKVLAAIPAHLRESQQSLVLDQDGLIKALGVEWCPSEDNFVFAVPDPALHTKVTKRAVLSELAKVFDPIGFLSPTTIRAKILFQELWKLDLMWDDELPTNILYKWHEYYSELQVISQINIPRCIKTEKSIKYEFHGFSDASEQAYSAVVYLRTQQEDM